MRALDLPLVNDNATVWVSWDFSPFLATGETLSTITSTVSVLATGDDPSPASRLIGVPAIVNALPPPEGSGLTNAMVTQQFSNGIANATYDLQAVATTSKSQTLPIEMYLPVGASATG